MESTCCQIPKLCLPYNISNKKDEVEEDHISRERPIYVAADRKLSDVGKWQMTIII